nr:glycoside hydrolase family 3 N-terminal domain-containing protein [Knoellia sp. DB2414S]
MRPARALGALAVVSALGVVTACSTGEPGASPTTSAGASSTTSTSTTSTSTASGTTSAAPTTSPSTTVTASSTPVPPSSCGQRLASAMTPAQRAGQLLMVGMQSSGSSRALAAQVKKQGLGSVIFLGGWNDGSASVATVSKRLQAAAGGDLLIAADQEGGQVQQLRGAGFTRFASARTQAQSSPGAEERNVTAWSRELRKAGINVNLAPVADTVPTALGAGNAPIGRFRRDFAPGSPRTNATYAAAFVRGSLAADVAPTVKHFPGLGRVTGNTDVTASGITDSTTAAGDPYLAPFEAGIRAGAPLVMISSARYPRIDPDNQAVFSKAVITDLLRGDLGFDGVVITDDVGAAKAVAAVSPGARATRFIAAGGDIVLIAQPGLAAPMLSAIAQKRVSSKAFAAQVDAAAARVLDLKVDLGLVRC